MLVRHHVYRLLQRAAVSAGLLPTVPKVHTFALKPEEIAKLRSGVTNDMQRAFFGGTKRPVYKWSHYLDIYERHLSTYRGTPLFFLEIGVSAGGSLEMWRRFFGAKATIVGIDIDEACQSRVDPPNVVRIGSQTDPPFLQKVVDEFGPPDVILDDGSHIGSHQQKSFETLFPRLKEGGLYMIEDMHTSYWPDWEGGYRRKGSAIEYVKQMIDDLHAWYHNRPTASPARDEINAIHIYDSVVVLEKRRKSRPGFLEAHGLGTQSSNG